MALRKMQVGLLGRTSVALIDCVSKRVYRILQICYVHDYWSSRTSPPQLEKANGKSSRSTSARRKYSNWSAVASWWWTKYSLHCSY